MNQNEGTNTSELAALLRGKNGHLSPEVLRCFACVCCKRVSRLCQDPLFLRLLEFAFGRASGEFLHDQLIALRSEASLLYDSLYPGYGTPSASALALTAVGEAAFTESALDAAISASSTSAEASATSATANVEDAEYDSVYGTTFQNEQQAQMEVLRQLINVMNPLQQFLSITVSYESGDMWSDHGVNEAVATLGTFESNDWQELKTRLLLLPDDQLQRIANALADGLPEETCPLLLHLIESKNKDTALAACDSLRSILETHRRKMPVSLNVIDSVQFLAIEAEEPWKTSCQFLLKHLYQIEEK
ncbi:MAG: hypothetical protein U0798_18670 [Gemmataceae bacterium]